MTVRKAKFMVILGTNGTGKTTTIRKIMKRYKGNVLVCTPDYQEWTDLEEIHSTTTRSRGKSTPKFNVEDFRFEGSRRIVLYDPKLTNLALEYINKYVRNTLVVFDDCRSYIESRTDIELKRVYIRRRQCMNDIAMVGHGFTEVPPRAFTFCSEIILFKTIDSIDTRKPYLQDFEKMKAKQAQVNKTALKNPHHFEIIAQ